ncbi:MAG: SDR family oxidoreductase [Acidobacteriota bacterium]|nr:SDR family oxidoreductase [Acidobacteriota bacterium]
MSAQSVHAFAEKVALITDGASSIGRAVALQLALQGCYVIVGFSRISEESRHALAELENLGTLASAVEADISTVDGAKKLVGEVEKMFGRLDLLVNCLNFRSDSAFEETTEDIYKQTFDANLKATFFVTQEAARLMKHRPKPKIVNVTSAVDTPETEANVLFASSQKALLGLTKSLAAGLPKNFRVNAVALSEKQPELEDNLDAELFRPKKAISEDDAARTIVYLLSPEAIALNGQILRIA